MKNIFIVALVTMFALQVCAQTRCKGINGADGKRCNKYTTNANGYCFLHQTQCPTFKKRNSVYRGRNNTGVSQTRCKGINGADGKRCNNYTTNPNGYCFLHQSQCHNPKSISRKVSGTYHSYSKGETTNSDGLPYLFGQYRFDHFRMSLIELLFQMRQFSEAKRMLKKAGFVLGLTTETSWVFNNIYNKDMLCILYNDSYKIKGYTISTNSYIYYNEFIDFIKEAKYSYCGELLFKGNICKVYKYDYYTYLFSKDTKGRLLIMFKNEKLCKKQY